MSLSKQSIALVQTTKNKETKHHIQPELKRETEKSANQTTPSFGMPFMPSNQEKEWALFLQFQNLHVAYSANGEVKATTKDMQHNFLCACWSMELSEQSM